MSDTIQSLESARDAAKARAKDHHLFPRLDLLRRRDVVLGEKGKALAKEKKTLTEEETKELVANRAERDEIEEILYGEAKALQEQISQARKAERKQADDALADKYRDLSDEELERTSHALATKTKALKRERRAVSLVRGERFHTAEAKRIVKDLSPEARAAILAQLSEDSAPETTA